MLLRNMVFIFINGVWSCGVLAGPPALSPQSSVQYQTSSTLEERRAQSDLLKPATNALPTSKNVTILSSPGEKINLNVDEKNENIIAQSIEELNLKKYASAIGMINSYLNAKKGAGSSSVADMMSTSPMRDVQLILAIAYLNSSNEERALPLLNDLIFYSEKWEAVYITLCEYYLKKRAYSLLQSVALKGKEKIITPSVAMHVYTAQAQLGLNQTVQAQKSLEQASVLFPHNPQVIGWLGVVDLKHHNTLQACVRFKKSFELSATPSSFLTYYHAACMLQSHAYEEATSLVKTGIYNFPSNASFYYLGGLLEAAQGHRLNEKQYWEGFIKLTESTDQRLPYVRAAVARSAENQ